MIKKKHWILVIGFIFILSVGCQAIEEPIDQSGGPREGIRGKGLNSLWQEGGFDATNHPPGTTDPRMPFGFIEYAADDPEVIHSGYGADAYLDRQVVADTISKIVLSIEELETAAVLVTDEECLVGYQANGGDEDLLQKVEQSASSVVPRWFDIYVTDDRTIIEQLRMIGQNGQRGHFTAESKQQINAMIQQMGGSKESR